MTKNKKNILIVISSDLYIRNYIFTDAFSKLHDLYNCHYLGSRDIEHSKGLASKPGFHGFYRIENSVRKSHLELFNVLMWLYRHKSSSFRFRIQRATPDFMRVVSGPFKRMHLRFIKWFFLKPYLVLKRTLLDISFIEKWVLNNLKNKLKRNPFLQSHIEENDYDLVIFPTSAYDVEAIDIALICDAKNIKTLFLADNWDNLSSKSILWKKPTFIGVWGDQSKEHAVTIQGFDERKVIVLGTPRFDHYFQSRNSVIDSYFDFKYLLFVGTALDFDEESLLSVIDMVVDKYKKVWGNIKVIYRPHPWRQNLCQVKETYGSHIVTDPQILMANNDKTTSTQPDLEYYPSLLKNAEYVMGGLTSMLIEGLIFNKQFLAFVHEDKAKVTNMRNAWDYFEHFRGLEKVEAMSFSYDQNDVEEKMLNCWNKIDLIENKIIDRDRSWFLFDDGKKYKHRLAQSVGQILGQ